MLVRAMSGGGGGMPSNIELISDLSINQYQTNSVTITDSYGYLSIYTADIRTSGTQLYIRPKINNVDITTNDIDIANCGGDVGFFIVPQSVKSGDVVSVTPQGGGVTHIYLYGVK